MKKILSFGMIATVITPIIGVVACGSTSGLLRMAYVINTDNKWTPTEVELNLSAFFGDVSNQLESAKSQIREWKKSNIKGTAKVTINSSIGTKVFTWSDFKASAKAPDELELNEIKNPEQKTYEKNAYKELHAAAIKI